MSGAVWSLFGNWWSRLLGRVGVRRERLPEVQLVSGPAPLDGATPDSVAIRAERIHAVSPAVARQALTEVLGGKVEAAPRPCPPAGDAAALRERTLAALGNLRQIPALQSFARNFLRTLGQTDVDVAEIVAVISKDSALCVRILRMANSVLVSSERRIDDLDSAVHMLGLARVRKAAQTLFMLRDGNRVAEGFDWRHLWMHAIATAAITEELEERLRGEKPPSLHVAALLHDVGKIVLSTVAPDEYRAILVATWDERGRLEDLELARLGVDHREAGVRFARQSGMPEMAVQAIAHHDRPQEAESCRFEVALVSLANYLSKAHGLGFSGARLEAADGDFADLPAWQVIEEELGYRPDTDTLEQDMVAFAATVRAELRALHE